MKRLVFLLTALITVIVFSCNKADDDFNSDQNQGAALKHSSTPIPFNGSLTGVFTAGAGDCGTGWTARHFEGQGNVTHMGRTTFLLDYCFKQEFPTPGPGIDGIFNGPGVFIAANGDQLHGYFTGTETFTWNGSVPTGSSIDADAVLFGGTGRFEGAYGTIHLTGSIVFGEESGPGSLEFTGTIHYGAEYFETTVSGNANYLGSCGSGSNQYNLTGDGIGVPLGPIEGSMTYCASTEFLGPYPIGGNMAGTGEMENENGIELYSEYNGIYRFTYMSTYMVNDFIGKGNITGGTGMYNNATGKFIHFGYQTIQLGYTGGIFPAPGTMTIIGYIDN